MVFVCWLYEPQHKYLPAYGLAVAPIVQLVCFCVVGTVVEVAVSNGIRPNGYSKAQTLNEISFPLSIPQNDRMHDSIISGNWYLLPIEQQSMYKHFMQNALCASTLSIGGVAPLNMVSCHVVCELCSNICARSKCSKMG